LNKNISFPKITDPAKRDLLVQELIKTHRNILQDSINEKVGEITTQQSLSRLTEKIETTTQAIKTLPVLPAIQAAPQLAALPPPSAQAPPLAQALVPPPGQQVTTKLGEIATDSFMLFTTKTKDVDTTYGIYDKAGKFYIGDTEIRIDGDDIIVGDRVYEGTPGLWELIVSKTPSDYIYTLSDKERYIDILTSTNVLKWNNDPNETYPKSSRSNKWTSLLKPIWSEYSRASKSAPQHTGSSMKLAPIILPSDPIALLDRLDLLLASH
jgi:hypothetical protein